MPPASEHLSTENQREGKTDEPHLRSIAEGRIRTHVGTQRRNSIRTEQAQRAANVRASRRDRGRLRRWQWPSPECHVACADATRAPSARYSPAPARSAPVAPVLDRCARSEQGRKAAVEPFLRRSFPRSCSAALPSSSFAASVRGSSSFATSARSSRSSSAAVCPRKARASSP